jgi:hypothetical protein
VGDAASARTVALRAIDDGAALGLVQVIRRCETECSAAVLDVRDLSKWDADSPLPASVRPATMLPPVGREDLECRTLDACRQALLVAHAAELLQRIVVTAILDIVQQAFQGIGPAVEEAAAMSREVDCATRIRAS